MMTRLLAAVTAALVSCASMGRAAELEVVQSSGIGFGAFVPLGEGSITVPPSGFASYVGTAPVGGQASSGRFQIRGDPSALVEVRLPTGAIPLRASSGAVRLQDFTLEASEAREIVKLGGGRYRMRLDASGLAGLHIGATLTVSGPNPGPERADAARFTITASYAEAPR